MKHEAARPSRTDEFDAFSRPARSVVLPDDAPVQEYENPPWIKVCWTSVRLAVRRTVGERVSRSVLIAAGCLLALGVAGFALVWLISSESAAPPADRPAASAAVPNPIAAAAAARAETSAWVAENVADGTLIACDPATCTGLQARGYLPTALVPLVGSGADVRSADVVLVTSAVRARLGLLLDELVAATPIATFGTASTAVEIRAVTLDGPEAYAERAATDLADRQAAGQALAGAHGLDLTGVARTQLTSGGGVDGRLLSVLPPLLAQHEISIVRFGATPSESVDAPMRVMDIDRIDGTDVDAVSPATADVIQFLHAQQSPFEPASVEIVTDAGAAVLRISYPAPSPLGVLGAG